MYGYRSEYEYGGYDLWVVVLMEHVLLLQIRYIYCCIILTFCLGGECCHMAWFDVVSYDIGLCFRYPTCVVVCVCDSGFEYSGYNLNVVDRIEQWIVNSNSAYQKTYITVNVKK